MVTCKGYADLLRKQIRENLLITQECMTRANRQDCDFCWAYKDKDTQLTSDEHFSCLIEHIGLKKYSKWDISYGGLAV